MDLWSLGVTLLQPLTSFVLFFTKSPFNVSSAFVLQSGGYLEASVVYCTWAVKYFWDGDGKKEPENGVSHVFYKSVTLK